MTLFSWKSDGGPSLSGAMTALPSDDLYMRNVSALSVDPRTGHTLVLSAESHLLLELDEKGEPVSFISLLGGFNGLDSKIPRAEGVAIDDEDFPPMEINDKTRVKLTGEVDRDLVGREIDVEFVEVIK